MNDHTPPKNMPSARKRWVLWSGGALVGVLLGGIVYWQLRQASPDRFFEAGKQAFAVSDMDGLRFAAEALRGQPDYEPHLHLLEGMVLLGKGRHQEAIRSFALAREHPDTRALAYELTGRSLYRAGDFRGAEPILSTAVQYDPSLIDARRWLAALYYDMGAMSSALAQLKIIAEQAPKDPRAHRLQGLIYKDAGRFDEAIDAYRESLRRQPEQPDTGEIQLELAECLLYQKRYGELAETLRQCSQSAHSLYLEAQGSYAQGDKTRARQLADESLKLMPNHLGAMNLRAKIGLESDELDVSTKILEQAARQYPKDCQVHESLAEAYRRASKQELSQEQIKISKELRDRMARFTELHREADKDPTNVEIRYQLGVVANELGKIDLAETWFRAALSMDRNHAGARKALQAMPK